MMKEKTEISDNICQTFRTNRVGTQNGRSRKCDVF